MLSSACLAVAAVLCAGRVAADTSCSPDNQCPLGCCSISGKICGFGPDYCAPATCNAAASANGTCNQLAECDPGVFPGWGETWGPQYAAREGCPLNVCCSKFGFCGTTEEFCGDSSVSEPSCSGSSATGRTIGYYEGWALTRPCDAMAPEDIPVGAFTHLNFGFLSIDPGSFAVVPEDPSEEGLYARFTALKRRKPGLQTWLRRSRIWRGRQVRVRRRGH
ncbi:hypothetical protein VTK73DRAFT_7375 [Phialemonium thermophilum]|uniref:Chitin-binding type-1 domain-containing protein n=1 Tax=Phialemonium thermophilum TaxID=223376 RepID=A0ABR3WFC9_9PEZI